MSKLHSLPVYLKLPDVPVLVVGGGRIGTRRIEQLLAAEARVTVVAPRASDAVAAWAARAAVQWQARAFQPDDIRGQQLVFSATGEAPVNAAVAAAARAAGCRVHRADDAADSDFFVPAIVDRSPLLIAISSGARAPTLSRRLRATLESWVPAAYGDLAALAGRFRSRVVERLPLSRRARFWERVFDGPIAEKVFAGRVDEAERDLAAVLTGAAATPEPGRGEVYLVGGGPGDPDLLTFRALRLMQQADVVLYDSLISPKILALVRTEAERIHVGKRAARHTLPQEDINDLMVRLAREGKRVLRLKGGDPFVFGRGGEEIAELADAGIAFQIVPGITAASGCAAYAGIPLTHRDYAQAVIFVTGHLKAGALDLSWAQLAQPNQTVVFFMGRRSLPVICKELVAHGLNADWPAALVIEGTTANQRVVASTLEDLPDQAAGAKSAGPALLIVGEVVRLNEKLGWFHP